MEFENYSCKINSGNDFASFLESEEKLLYYFAEVWPLFLGLVLAEYFVLALKGRRPRLAESLNSLGHGILAESVKIITIGIEVSLYVSIHQNWRLLDLPRGSPVTWYVTFLGVDLAYYFAHRASHEVNFLWAQHHIHHSSEDFNMAVAIRHPISYSWINSFFYLPLALLIPPPHLLAYQQFNLIYQAWIHTTLVGSLGPLEYILNTPTHHRVHHGCNLYVLDKNFGGILIIWDRIFGTFRKIRDGEDLIFGIVKQESSFNPLWQMWHKFPGMWNRAGGQETWKDSLKVLFYGPSWIPGVDAPRLGRIQDKLNIRRRPKFEVDLPLCLQLYLILHFIVIGRVFQEFALHQDTLDELSLCQYFGFLVLSLTSVGLLSEGNKWGPPVELLRCLLCIPLATSSLQPTASFLFMPSALAWIVLAGIRMLSPGEIKASGSH